MTNNESPVIQINDLEFRWKANTPLVLNIPEFSVSGGERLFLRGPSGSGKTTLLSVIAAVLVPQSGTAVVTGVPLHTLKGGQKDQFRVDHIGLVFQQFNLLPFLSVLDNVVLPCKFSKKRRDTIRQMGSTATDEAMRLLKAMELPPNLTNQSVTELSVGQQQRVAVARALIGQPELIIADEPTSALDTDTRQAFLDLLFAEVQAANSSLLFVSHDVDLSQRFDRAVDLKSINLAAQALTDANASDTMRAAP